VEDKLGHHTPLHTAAFEGAITCCQMHHNNNDTILDGRATGVESLFPLAEFIDIG
jgi:hypothetical protein